jgi:hypothetical protein
VVPDPNLDDPLGEVVADGKRIHAGTNKLFNRRRLGFKVEALSTLTKYQVLPASSLYILEYWISDLLLYALPEHLGGYLSHESAHEVTGH